jgi:predicted DNA-binding protein (MmcQ/YjbR family)
MDEYETVRAWCLAQPGADEAFPFGPETAVLRVMGKMFAILVDDPPRLSLKCDPGVAEALRAAYPAVTPGYHLSKRHWNTILLDGSVLEESLLGWIEDSYELVVAGLTRADRAALAELARAGPGGTPANRSSA